jgi:hypothetical protein
VVGRSAWRSRSGQRHARGRLGGEVKLRPRQRGRAGRYYRGEGEGDGGE